MNHREEARVYTGEAANATILGHPDVTVPCRISNFSRSGMAILVNRPIPMGNAVKVIWDGHFLVGRVVRITKSGLQHNIGLQLLHCSKWEDRPQLVG